MTANGPDAVNGVRRLSVLGTPLQLTNYETLSAELRERSRVPAPWAVDFTNTHIVTLRRRSPEFRELTSRFDYFIPDGMPLIWCLNWRGARLRDRVYGPTFMRRCILGTPAPFTHYLLGGSEECVTQLKEFFQNGNSEIQIVGTKNGYFNAECEPEIVQEINRLSPDFIWIGLGTPKQQAWVYRNKNHIKRGVLLAVGFAFDVNAGMKSDAPMWMQRCGLTWMYRLSSEPLRLGPRYLRFNLWFIYYLLSDALRGRSG